MTPYFQYRASHCIIVQRFGYFRRSAHSYSVRDNGFTTLCNVVILKHGTLIIVVQQYRNAGIEPSIHSLLCNN